MSRKKIFRHWFFAAVDWVWPIVTPVSKEEEERRQQAAASRLHNDLNAVETLRGKSIGVVKKAREDVLDTLEKEKQRIRTVESKLATLIALSALSATLVLSVNGRSDMHWMILFTTGYCLLQLIRILFATLRGLRRRGFSVLSIADLSQTWVVTNKKRLLKVVQSEVKHSHEYQQAGNEKVTDLDIAHTALRNFLIGLLALFAVSTTFPPVSESVERRVERVIEEIERHPRILNALQGPQGEVGLPGPPEKNGSPELKGEQKTQ